MTSKLKYNLFIFSTFVILILSFQAFAANGKKNTISINVGLNHTGFEYINSASFFSDNLHINPNISVEFNHQLRNGFGFSVGIDYSMIGGKKSYSYWDSVYQYDSSNMTYQYISTDLFEGNNGFNFSYVSIPFYITYKIANLPLKASIGPSFGFVFKQERTDNIKGEKGAIKATPIDKRSQFHTRLNLALQYNFIQKPFISCIGIQYGYGLSKIETELTTRGIQNTNELRLFLSMSIL